MKKFYKACLWIGIFFSLTACDIRNIGQMSGNHIKDKSKSLTIASVDNPQLNTLEELSVKFEEEKGVKINFIFFPENMLRSEVTEDMAVEAGNYDIVTIGSVDTRFWAQRKWIESLEPHFSKMPAGELMKYDREDLLKPVTNMLTHKDELYALPFYGESSMTFYRKDLFEKAELEMPLHPTWEQIYEFAKKLHDPENKLYGIALRGLPGYGQNIPILNSLGNTFGARWFDMEWKPQFETQQMKETWRFYKELVKETAEPKITTLGFKECSDLMMNGEAALWYDSTIGADILESKESKVAGKIGYSYSPHVKKEYSNWLFSWGLAIESSSKNKDIAFEFVKWATSKEYFELVAEKYGWSQVPSGTRTSLYSNPNYKAAAPFADIVYDSIIKAEFEHPTIEPVPYVGLEDIYIPEFTTIGEIVSQMLVQYLKDERDLDDAIKECQTSLEIIMKENKYLK